MKKFAVVLHGSNLEILDENNQPVAKGFYVTIFVEATHETEAASLAMDVLLQSEQYTSAFTPEQRRVLNIEIDNVEPLDSFDDVPLPMTGFVFYGDEEDALNALPEELMGQTKWVENFFFGPEPALIKARDHILQTYTGAHFEISEDNLMITMELTLTEETLDVLNAFMEETADLYAIEYDGFGIPMEDIDDPSEQGLLN